MYEIDYRNAYRTHTAVPEPSKAIARAKQLRNEIIEQYHRDGSVPADKDMEDYEYEVFFGEGTAGDYAIAAAFAAEQDFQTVFDIGSAMAEQSELFESMGISYVAVESCVPSYIKASKIVEGRYPCALPSFDKQKTMGISRLCVGYLIEGDDAYRALYNHFDHLLLIAPHGCLAKMFSLYGNILPVKSPAKNMFGQPTTDYWYYFTKQDTPITNVKEQNNDTY